MHSNLSPKPTLDEVVSLSKRRGFVYPTSSIYGGLTSSYDYGPLGAELLRSIRNAWWDFFITKRPDMVGLDSQILLHPQTWVASGHVDSFSDPLVEDVKTKKRYRADHIIEAWIETHPQTTISQSIEDMNVDDMAVFLADQNVTSPEGNPLSSPKAFNLLFETAIGSVAGEKAKVYLRGETAQGIFTNFKNILDSTRVQLPFGVGQIGKSFRNEITTGQFVFRTLEFEQAEIEYFFNPKHSSWQQHFQDWQNLMWEFITDVMGIAPDHLRWRKHSDTERSFYSLETQDLEYQFPFGWKELWGIAYRTDYDLKQHEQLSGESLHYTDPHTGESFIPHVIEPALGIARLFLMILCDHYWFDSERNRTVLKLPHHLAPVRAAVFPLLRNKPELVQVARKAWQTLSQHYSVSWDDRGNIGKRYLYQDEVGTPYCITVDYQTLEDDTVTIRDRDTAVQERVSLNKMVDYLEKSPHLPTK
ncbi:glycine--tRNA ligase [Candidatus Woesebacteria bacterium]|nr:glycine--tRNA ligase [Candidatus Woesebacteria bacterium]